MAWAECDAAGKVFYPNFYIWFDRATERLFQAHGLSFGELRRDFGIVGMPLLETNAVYENVCRHEDVVRLDSWVGEWGSKPFVVRHRVTHADGRAALAGFERRVFVVADPKRPSGIRAIAAPPAIRDRLSASADAEPAAGDALRAGPAGVASAAGPVRG
ncbi:MAG: acyl-CoA thioesterase [Burkholderiales bacterium]|nr:acyl-CoA thioesterase [Burkholderiales bacterium]